MSIVCVRTCAERQHLSIPPPLILCTWKKKRSSAAGQGLVSSHANRSFSTLLCGGMSDWTCPSIRQAIFVPPSASHSCACACLPGNMQFLSLQGGAYLHIDKGDAEHDHRPAVVPVEVDALRHLAPRDAHENGPCQPRENQA